MAINKIDNQNIEIVLKNTKNDPIKTLSAAKELGSKGVKIVIGPVFNKNLVYLDELNEMIFLSLTNLILVTVPETSTTSPFLNAPLPTTAASAS